MAARPARRGKGPARRAASGARPPAKRGAGKQPKRAGGAGAGAVSRRADPAASTPRGSGPSDTTTPGAAAGRSAIRRSPSRGAASGEVGPRRSGTHGRGSGAGGGGPARRQAAPRGLGGDQVEGRQAVRELLLAGKRKTRELWLSTELDPAPMLDDIVSLARELRVPTHEVSRGRLDGAARTDAPQGVLARAAPLPDAELDDLARPVPGRPPPFVLCCDGITDPGNLGALLRSAECAGVTGVVLPRHRAVHVTPTVAKAAAGAIEHVPMALAGGTATALRRLSELGLIVVGLDETADTTLWDLAVADGPIALVLGAEGSGLGRLVRQRCDQVVAIPMRGRLSSLNVATAGALACFEIARRRS